MTRSTRPGALPPRGTFVPSPEVLTVDALTFPDGILPGSDEADAPFVPDPALAPARALLREAIAASGLSNRQFAEQIVRADERTVRRWLGGRVPITGSALALCAAIVSDPTLVATLRALPAHFTLPSDADAGAAAA